MRLRFSIAVAGSHGKTTTTSMIALVLERAGLDPTAVIGGRLSAFGSNARLGRGEYMVAEADESDRSFLMLWPSIAVMTNIDHEHMESYGSFDELQQAFADFANKVPFYGSVVACADDPHLAPVLPRLKRRRGDLRARQPGGAHRRHRRRARVRSAARCIGAPPAARSGTTGSACSSLRVPGRHNLQNALAAVAVGDRARRRVSTASPRRCAEFQGAERRFERHGEAGGVLVVDDYGHHPTEIAAVLAAARATLGRRLSSRSSRTATRARSSCWTRSDRRCRDADEIVLTDIYAASEEPIPGVTVEALADVDSPRIGPAGPRGPPLDDVVPDAAVRSRRPGDAVITLGAGSIGTLPQAAASRRSGSTGERGADGGFRPGGQTLPPRPRQPGAQARAGCASRGSGRVVRRGGRSRSSCMPAIAAPSCVMTAEALTVTRITVSGNTRLSRGEVLALLDGLRGTNMVHGRPRELAAEAAGVAVGRRRGDPPRAARAPSTS